jgi:rhamnulose-1-phosphate aldolase/alcohol dehydrogenase
LAFKVLKPNQYKHVDYLWDDKKVKAFAKDEVELLIYRSNILGADLRITNYAGGNTSCKCKEKDPLTGKKAEILWVKGSGGDLGTMQRGGLSSLYKGIHMEDKMVGYLPHCTYNLNPRAASIDTPLHAFLPGSHIDHMHPDAMIALAASKGGRKLTEEIFGGAVGWVEWQRPGFDLGLKLEAEAAANPDIIGIVMGGHGVINWGNSAKECYERTLTIIEMAARHIAKVQKKMTIFKGAAVKPLAPKARAEAAANFMPTIRGLVSKKERMVGHFTDSPEVLQYVNSKDMKRLAALGTSCPDHFLRTKVLPLVMPVAPDAYPAKSQKKMDAAFAQYRKDYQAYYTRNKFKGCPAIRDANPVVFLWPRVGMLTFAKNKTTARLAAEFYINAINVMRGAEALSKYTGIPESEKFNIEYWELEEAKLRRMPKEQPLSRRVALITGGASGIGKSTAERFVREGSCVVITDLDQKKCDAVVEEFSQFVSRDQLHAVAMNVCNEDEVKAAFASAAQRFGGVDILLNNAGYSVSAPLVSTETSDYDGLHDVIARGSFFAAREFARQVEEQGVSGDIVYITSKNAVVSGPKNVAYGSAKAAQLHQARLLATELGDMNLRVNCINPDAVIRGSSIWGQGWAKQRAAAYGVSLDKLGAHYADRPILHQEVFPEDIADAAFVLVGGELSKTTGATIPVDGGLAMGFLR